MTEETLKELREKIFEDLSDDDIIRNIRRTIEARDHYIEDFPGILDTGDLVIDSKNKEFGFLGGPINTMYGQAPDDFDPLMLVITRIHDKSKDTRGGSFRVRYTKSSSLKKIGIEDSPKPTNVIKDLRFHCNNECILDCTESCSLFKFKK